MRLPKFEDITEPGQIRDYLMGSRSKSTRAKTLYHYSNINAMKSMLEGGYLWLGSPKVMNDYLESDVISSISDNTLFFSSFSTEEENLAMYKLYASSPDGTMLVIPSDVVEEIEDFSHGKNETLFIVRDRHQTDETVEGFVYWATVCYKDLHDDTIRVGTVENSKITDPMNAAELAGLIKLNGWSYEREVRLFAKTERKLADNEKVALKLPDGFTKKVKLVLVPGFDKESYKKQYISLKRHLKITESEYDGIVDLGKKSNQTKAEKREVIDGGDEDEPESNTTLVESESEFEWEGHHVKEKNGITLAEGEYKGGKLVEGTEYNWVLAIWKRKDDEDTEDFFVSDQLRDDYEVERTIEPLTLDEMKSVPFTYTEMFQYTGLLIMDSMSSDYVNKDSMKFLFIADKQKHLDGDEVKARFTNFRTFESVFKNKELDEYKYIMTGKRKYDEVDEAEFDV